MKFLLKPEGGVWWKWQGVRGKWNYVHWGEGPWDVMKWLREVLK